MEIIWIGMAAFFGGIMAALLGWLGAQESFVGKKFMASVIRALIGGAVVAVAFSSTENIIPADYIIAFLGGTGVDATGHRIAAGIKKRSS